MKKNTPQSSTRLAQVAKELHKLADGIGAGKVQISGVELSLSDSVTLKVKQKMTGSKVIFDLKIQALLASEDTRGKKKSGTRKKSPKATRAYGVKGLKKKYTAVWRLVAARIKKGEQPAQTDVQELQAVSQAYGESAPPEWATLWQAHAELVATCVAAAKAGDFRAAGELLTDIGRGKKSCHKMYK